MKTAGSLLAGLITTMQHAIALGAIGILLTAAVTIATWNKGPAFGPHWYPIALIVLALPCAWMGGKLRTA